MVDCSDAGLRDFLKHDITDLDDAHSVGRKALCDLAIDTDGSWSGIWATAVRAVVAFMLGEGYSAPTRKQYGQLQSLRSHPRTDVEALGKWFDEAFPPNIGASVIGKIST